MRVHLTAAGIDATLAPGVKTFARFAESLVSLDSHSAQIFPNVATRWLLKQMVAELLAAGKLRAMASVATRSGMVDAIERMIAELKQRGISAESFATWAGGARRSVRDRELAIVYQTYQARLDNLKAADQFDLAQLAAEAILRTKDPKDNWDLVVVDQFASFAYYERQLLLAIADRSHETWIALATEDTGNRLELCSTARRTLAWLTEERPTMNVVQAQAKPAEYPTGLHTLSSELYASPGEQEADGAQSAKVSAGLELVAASDPYDEAITVARRIKRLLTSGVAAADIVVTMDSVASMRPRLQEVFETYGIPASFMGPKFLKDDASLVALSSGLAMAAEDWPFRRVTQVLTTALFAALDGPCSVPPWRTLRGAAEWVVRDLQVAIGRQALLRDLDRLVSSTSEQESPSPRAIAARIVQAPLNLLSDATSALPRSATPTEWAAASEKFATTLGLDLSPQPSSDWRQICEAAAWIERTASIADRATPQWTLAEWLAQLSDWMSQLSGSVSSLQEGTVRVLSAAAARYVAAEHLFVMGLDEQAFSARSNAGSLYSNQQYDELVAVDSSGKLLQATPAYERAMQLFYDVVRTPRTSLMFSFAALDGAGQPVPPSSMLVEACRPFGEAFVGQLDKLPTISALPPGDKPPCSLRDWRLLGVDRASEKQPALLGKLLASPLAARGGRSLHDALTLVHHRTRGDSFGPLEGILATPAAQAWFGNRFGAAHQWSTSQLETYALCPYRFLMKNVLGIEPLGDAALAVDYGRRGSLLHQVFGLLHKKLDQLASDRLPSDHEPAIFAEALEEAVYEAREQLARFGIEGVLDELLANEVQQWATKYQDQHRQYDNASRHFDQPLRPTHFELRFGKASRDSADEESPASTDEPFRLDLGDGMVVELGGRIDRVDIGQIGQTSVFQVIDYKSAGSFGMKPQEVEDGRKLQPPLYALAAAQVLGSQQVPAVPLGVGYWVLRDRGFNQSTSRQLHEVEAGEVQQTDFWRNLQPVLRQRIRELVQGVRSAHFPMHSPDDKCTSHCDYSHVCRVGLARSLNKQWPPPEQTPEESQPNT